MALVATTAKEIDKTCIYTFFTKKEADEFQKFCKGGERIDDYRVRYLKGWGWHWSAYKQSQLASTVPDRVEWHQATKWKYADQIKPESWKSWKAKGLIPYRVLIEREGR